MYAHERRRYHRDISFTGISYVHEACLPGVQVSARLPLNALQPFAPMERKFLPAATPTPTKVSALLATNQDSDKVADALVNDPIDASVLAECSAQCSRAASSQRWPHTAMRSGSYSDFICSWKNFHRAERDLARNVACASTRPNETSVTCSITTEKPALCSSHAAAHKLSPSLCCSMSGLSRPGSCTSPEAAAPTTSAAASAVASSIAGRSSSAISSVAAHTIR
mmetsp:Transcript_11837/g.25606  ORF Transcript_11837/g.25606 Transcript_11837/m.25606 type:complete len:224 (-) Transcript_11837:222-893(-)